MLLVSPTHDVPTLRPTHIVDKGPCIQQLRIGARKVRRPIHFLRGVPGGEEVVGDAGTTAAQATCTSSAEPARASLSAPHFAHFSPNTCGERYVLAYVHLLCSHTPGRQMKCHTCRWHGGM